MKDYRRNSELGVQVMQHLERHNLEYSGDFALELSPYETNESFDDRKEKGVEFPCRKESWESESEVKEAKKAIGTFLQAVCHSPFETTQETSSRVWKAWSKEILYGLDYGNFPDMYVQNSTRDQMVVVQNMKVQSVCEHHFLPVVGTATVAYIPEGKVCGLSKIPRLVDFFSHRPQLQERLVEQIAHALAFCVGTTHVAAVVSAKHLCMTYRGVNETEAYATTSKLLGNFINVGSVREEFLMLYGGVK